MSRLFSRSNDDDDLTLHDADDDDTLLDDDLGDDPGDDAEDDLSDIDDDLKERFERQLQRQERAYQAELKKREEAAAGVGLSFDSSGRIAVSDTGKAAQYFSPLSRREDPAPPPQPVPKAEEPEEEWVDPSYDKDAFQKQLGRYVAKETAGYQQQLQAMQSFIVEDKIDQAIEKCEAAVTKHAPYLADLLEHPEFEGAMRNALGQLQMNQWRTPKDLARVVGLIAPDLAETMERKAPKPKAGPSPQEKFRSQVQRSTMQQIAPSRATSPGRGKEFSDEDRMVAERLGIPLEEAAALGEDTYGDGYRAVRAKTTKGKR